MLVDRAVAGVFARCLERLPAPALFAPHEIDRAPVDEREEPRPRFRTFGHELVGASPRLKECFLHGILGERLVPQDSQRETVCHATEPVVQLGERVVVGSRHECDNSFVREVGECAQHRRDSLAHRFSFA